MPQPLMMPNMNYLDLVEVLETRNINFNKPFTQDFCDEVVDVLDKVITYDKLMNYKDDEKYIRITLSTPGGSIFALFEVLDKIETMKKLNYTIHCHVTSMAASCGFILFVSGNYRTISPMGFLLNHQGSSMSAGTVKEMEISLDLMKKIEAQLNGYIRANTTLSEDEIMRPYRTNTDVWYTSQDALNLGLVDEIVNL